MNVVSDFDVRYIVCDIGIQSLGGCPLEKLLDGPKVPLLGAWFQRFLAGSAKVLATQIGLIGKDIGALCLLDSIAE